MYVQPPGIHRQRGAILVVSLLLLLVMTVLALTASQSTRMQERIRLLPGIPGVGTAAPRETHEAVTSRH